MILNQFQKLKKKNKYDSVIIAVAHKKFKELGIKFISTLCKENNIIFEIVI